MRYQLDDLLYLMQRLRDPQHGCPWDLQQDYASIVPHTLEEAYEVADAIEQGDAAQAQQALCDHVLIQGERFSDFVASVRRMEAPMERTG